MLSLQLKSGEYLTIGDNIAVQVFEQPGASFRVAVKAPREIPILRGEVLERTEYRPDGLLDKRPKSPSERLRNAQRLEKMAAKKEKVTAERTAVVQELRHILDRVDEVAAAHGAEAGLAAELAGLRARLDSLDGAV